MLAEAGWLKPRYALISIIPSSDPIPDLTISTTVYLRLNLIQTNYLPPSLNLLNLLPSIFQLPSSNFHHHFHCIKSNKSRFKCRRTSIGQTMGKNSTQSLVYVEGGWMQNIYVHLLLNWVLTSIGWVPFYDGFIRSYSSLSPAICCGKMIRILCRGEKLSVFLRGQRLSYYQFIFILSYLFVKKFH